MITMQGENGRPEQPYIDCIWEVGNKNGVLERYEFRCDAKQECCENICCTPQAQVDVLARLWMFIFVGVILVLLVVHTVRPNYRRLKETPASQNTVESMAQIP